MKRRPLALQAILQVPFSTACSWRRLSMLVPVLVPVLVLVVVLVVVFNTSICFSQEADLPADREVIGQIIHGIKYPLTKKFSIHAAVQSYYGDRLARTMGYSVEPRYNLSERTWLSVAVAAFRSQLEAGLAFSGSGPLVVYEPKLMISPEFGWNPIYGKFLMGKKIHHFRAGLNIGAAAIQTQILAPFAGDMRWTYGAVLGVQYQQQLGPSWLIEVFSTALVYSAVRDFEKSDSSSNRIGWQYGLKLGRTL